MVNMFKTFGNPFAEASSKLLVLDSTDVMDGSAVHTVNNIRENKEMCKFCFERFLETFKTLEHLI